MYGLFAGPKKSGRNNELTVLPRWTYKTGYHCSTQNFLGAAYYGYLPKGFKINRNCDENKVLVHVY